MVGLVTFNVMYYSKYNVTFVGDELPLSVSYIDEWVSVKYPRYETGFTK